MLHFTYGNSRHFRRKNDNESAFRLSHRLVYIFLSDTLRMNVINSITYKQGGPNENSSI